MAGELDLERFIDTWLLRDRAKAERLATAHEGDPHLLLLALIGPGHLEAEGGVPGQLRRVAAGSVAAGLEPGDRLLAVNGEPVERAGQVRRRVRERPVGVPLR